MCKDKITSFFLAVLSNDLDRTKALLEEGVPVNSSISTTALLGHWPTEKLHFGRLDFDLQTFVYESTELPACWTSIRPLHLAARSHQSEMLELLLSSGADVEASLDAGVSCLMVAVAFRRLNIVELLLEHGAEADARTDWGKSALHYAVQTENCWLVHLLLERGAEPEAEFGPDRLTALHLATEAGYGDVALVLVGHAADPDRRTTAGATALHYAVASGDPNLVGAMLEAGASLDQVLRSGRIDLSMFPWISGNILRQRLRMMEQFLPKRRLFRWFYEISCVIKRKTLRRNVRDKRAAEPTTDPSWDSVYPNSGIYGFDFDVDL